MFTNMVYPPKTVQTIIFLGVYHTFSKRPWNPSRAYDYILDVAGSRTLSEYKRVLKPSGKVIPIGGPPKMSRVLGLHLRAMFSSYQSAPFVSYPNHEDLKLLGEWMEQEALTPVIDKVYPLHDTPNAFAYLGTGHARAKVVIVPSTP